MLSAETPGATASFQFAGTAVGLFVAAGPDAGVIEFQIDGGQFRRQGLFTPWSPQLHIPWAYVLDADLAHEPKSTGTAVRIVRLIVNESCLSE